MILLLILATAVQRISLSLARKHVFLPKGWAEGVFLLGAGHPRVVCLYRRIRGLFACIGRIRGDDEAHLYGGPRVPNSDAEPAAGTEFVVVSRGPQAGPKPRGCEAPKHIAEPS
jgi:hypothetical protein